MRFYLAARYSRHPEMRAYMSNLFALEHEVSSRWIAGDHEAPATASLEKRQQYAEEDYYDLKSSDAIIAFTEEPDVAGRGRGGRHVEFGIGIEAGKLAIVIGPRENVFYCLSQVYRFDTWEEFLEALKEGEFKRG